MSAPVVLIDTHAHLDDDRFQNDLPAVLERASQMGLRSVFTIGIDLATSRAAVELAQRYPMVQAVVGIQPNHVSEAQETDFEQIVGLAKHPKVIAIGETGLDRYWDRAPFDLQETYFIRHLQLARSTPLPVIIHCREAEADVVRVLRSQFEQHGPIQGVMHSFSGDTATALACVELGLHISFAGMLTFKNNQALRDVAKQVPLHRLLVETDSPYLAPMPHRGKRNEPAYVRFTAACLADLLSISLEEFAQQTTANAERLFSLN